MYMFHGKDLMPRWIKWMWLVKIYDGDIFYRPGRVTIVVVFISRKEWEISIRVRTMRIIITTSLIVDMRGL